MRVTPLRAFLSQAPGNQYPAEVSLGIFTAHFWPKILGNRYWETDTGFGKLFSLVAGRPHCVDEFRGRLRKKRYHVRQAARELLSAYQFTNLRENLHSGVRFGFISKVNSRFE